MRAAGSGRARTFGLTAISAAAHVVVFTFLGLVPPPSDVLAMHEMEFEVAEALPEAEPPPPPPPPPEPEPPKEKAPRAKAAEPPPEAEPPPPDAPPPEEVADFTGTTLTADGPGGWSTAVGSGAPLTGPVGRIGRKAADPGQQVAAKPVATGPRVVALKSLARRPSAPAGLDALLERHYPQRARAQGVEGKVVVALRVLPTGRLTDLRVVREWPSGFEFAEACRKLLREAPAFVPPLDRDGSAVAADIDFTCDFVVDY